MAKALISFKTSFSPKQRICIQPLAKYDIFTDKASLEGRSKGNFFVNEDSV